MIQTLILATGVALLTVVFLAFAPRCPECGSYLSETNRESSRIRHCRSCRNTYEVKR